MGQYVDSILQVLFFTAFAVPAYSYFLFPVILYIIVQFKAKQFRCSDDHIPSVTLLISAYNEAAVIQEKIENSLALDYPSDKLQVIVINDGSSDGTDAIVERYAAQGITHHRVEGRVGKNVAINSAWPMVKGEIVVFSDATSLYCKEAIRRMVSHFADERIGCVGGEVRYVDAQAGMAQGEDSYWKYERYLKRLESSIGQLFTLSGAIFAIRHDLFRELHPRIANDFQIPVDVASRGFSIIYEPEAATREKAAASAEDKINQKARIIARGFQGFFRYFGEFHGIRLFLILSHKFLRWIVWFAMAIMLVTNTFLLQYSFFRMILVAQVFFYALACAGPLLNRVKLPGITIPYYFCIINLGAFVGFCRFVTRKQKANWEPPVSAR